MGIFSSLLGLECRGQGARFTLLFTWVLLTIFGGLCGCLIIGVFVKSPAEADLSKTLHLLGGAGLGLGQSITCFIFTYSTHEKKNPNMGITDIPTPTAASIIRLSRMWLVNWCIQPWKVEMEILDWGGLAFELSKLM